MGGKLLTPVDVVKAEWVSRGGDRGALDAKPPAPKVPEPQPDYILDPSTNTTYLKGKLLGKGGFARVHELTDLTTNQVFACKIVPKSRLTRPHHKEKILREIELHEQLDHPNIVRFHRFFEDERHVYILLENCPRKSLLHVVRGRGRLGEDEARGLLAQAAEGVRYLHAQGLVHRDLKLANLLLDNDWSLKIGDFGLATQASGSSSTVCGTPNYIAPEVLHLRGHGAPADIWAMGCIVYAVLVGQPPFETATLSETYRRISANRYSVPAWVSAPARDLIARLLQPKPQDRPSAHEILRHPFFSEQDVEKIAEGVVSLHLSPEVPKNQEAKCEENRCSNCFPTNFKQKITNALCPDKIVKKPKEAFSSATMLLMLQNALDSMPEGACGDPPPLSCTVSPFISKWVDYSNKYGFAFQLSDRSFGALFNDSSKMSMAAKQTRVEFVNASGKSTVYNSSHIPSHLEAKYTLFRYFAEFMDENLSDGGELESLDLVKKKVPQMRRWLRTANAVVMQLSTGTLQINFFNDHSKIVISGEGMLMSIDKDRHSTTCSLSSLGQHGCSALLRSRLQYAASVLGDFARLEGTL